MYQRSDVEVLDIRRSIDGIKALLTEHPFSAVPLSRVIGPRKRPVLVAPPPRYRTPPEHEGAGRGYFTLRLRPSGCRKAAAPYSTRPTIQNQAKRSGSPSEQRRAATRASRSGTVVGAGDGGVVEAQPPINKAARSGPM